MPSNSRRHLLAMAVLCAVGAVIYSNTLEVPFVFDDEAHIPGNPHIRVAHFDVDQFFDAAFKSPSPSRFVANLTFAFNFYFGRYDVTGYHVINTMIHVVNGILVYFIAEFLFRNLCPPAPTTLARPPLPSPKRRKSSASPESEDLPSLAPLSSAFLPALFAALFFVAHPVQTSAVTYVVQRMTGLATLFFLASFLLYLVGREAESPRQRCSYWGGALVCWILALGSKEIAATLPLIVLGYEWFLSQGPSPRESGAEGVDAGWLRRNFKYVAGAVILFGLVALAYLGKQPWQEVMSAYERRDFTMGERLLTQFRVVIIYLGLILLPLPSRFNLLHQINTSHSLFDPPTTFAAILLVLGLMGLAIYWAKKQRLVSFCILWFFVNLAIESSFIGLEMIFEHRLYLPMVGFSVLAAYLIYWVVGRLLPDNRLGTAVVSFLIAGVLAGATYARNQVWKDSISLWSDVIAKNPTLARAYNNRGKAHYETTAYELAVRDYDRALELKPGHVRAANNRGLAYMEMGQHDLALKDYALSISLEPEYANPYYNRGVLFSRLGQHEQAIEQFSEAIRRFPDFTLAYNDRGSSRGMIGQFELAIEDFTQAIQRNPFQAEVFFNRASAYEAIENFELSARDYQEAVDLNPNYSKAYSRGATVLSQIGNIPLAIESYRKAIALDPKYKDAYRRLAWLLATCPEPYRDGPRAVERAATEACMLYDWKDAMSLSSLAAANVATGQLDEAIKWQKRAIQLAPENAKARLESQLELYQKLGSQGTPGNTPQPSEPQPDDLSPSPNR